VVMEIKSKDQEQQELCAKEVARIRAAGERYLNGRRVYAQSNGWNHYDNHLTLSQIAAALRMIECKKHVATVSAIEYKKHAA
jgi:hypothetical protein